MDILFNNPIAQMDGPNFLIFYGLVIAITAGWSAMILRDNTEDSPRLSVPPRPDPYEIAYLRGNVKQVLELICFELIQKGYLEVKGLLLQQVASHPQLSGVKPIDQKVFDSFKNPRNPNPNYIIFDEYLRKKLEEYCLFYQKLLSNKQLINNDKAKAKAGSVITNSALIIFGLGGYKLLSALARGYYNVGYLIIMSLLAMFLLVGIYNKAQAHQTNKGKRYLEQLKQAFKGLKTQLTNDKESDSDYYWKILVALFGAEVLVGSYYESYGQIFAKVTAPKSSSSSSSCAGGGCGGGGGGGGGGCGGGCGGCGGE